MKPWVSTVSVIDDDMLGWRYFKDSQTTMKIQHEDAT